MTAEALPIKRDPNLSKDDEDDACVDIFGKENGVVEDSDKENEAKNAEFMVSQELREQEERVMKENKKVEAKETKEDIKQIEVLTKEERFKRLTDLLSKSKFYSEFLLKKMQDEDEAQRLKNKKQSDRKKLKEDQEESAKKKPKGRGRKRKADQSLDDGARGEYEENKAKKLKPEMIRTFKGETISDEQPLLLTGGVMRDYQLKGYQWMSTLFENGINGILADEMGLGKTIQTIALFCHLVEMGVPGPYLIVAPLSTVPNWVKEFKRFAPCLPVVLYHGNKQEREELRQKLNETTAIEGIEKKVRNVFVTSFEISMNDRAHFSRVQWRYIVVDEGHRLKNTNCRLIKELKQYSSVNRLLLTGTPLQNNLAELWSLLNFLMAEIFDDLSVFESWFNAKDMDITMEESERILQQEKQNSILSTLHQILTPFLLRRVKSDVDLKIPPKKEVLVYCPMSTRQKELYEACVNFTVGEMLKQDNNDDFKVDLTGGRGKREKMAVDYSIFLGPDGESERNLEKYVETLNEFEKKKQNQRSTPSAYDPLKSIVTSDVRCSLKNRLMDLRKTTNHPYLMEYPLCDDGITFKVDQDLIDICGKMKVFDQMVEALLKGDHKILIFSQMTRMLDILGDYLNYKELKFSRLDGSMHFEDRQDNIDRFNEDPDTKLFLLSTRAGGLGINLTAADTCIIFDSDWNPQQDLQAQDRCHRIGQTKPVMVYRLVTAKTIDQKIVERAAAKRKLEKMVIHSKKFKSQDKEGLTKTMQAISPQELLDLLNSEDHAGVVDRVDGDVFTEDELAALLDRSDLHWGTREKVSAPKMALEEKELPKMVKPKEGKGRGRPKKGAKKEEKKVNNNAGALFKLVDFEEGSSTLLKSVKED